MKRDKCKAQQWTKNAKYDKGLASSWLWSHDKAKDKGKNALAIHSKDKIYNKIK